MCNGTGVQSVTDRTLAFSTIACNQSAQISEDMWKCVGISKHLRATLVESSARPLQPKREKDSVLKKEKSYISLT